MTPFLANDSFVNNVLEVPYIVSKETLKLDQEIYQYLEEQSKYLQHVAEWLNSALRNFATRFATGINYYSPLPT